MKNRHKVAKSIYFPDNTVSKKYGWWCMKGGIGGEIEIIVYDKDKNIIQHIKKPMDSFVQNMKRWMCEVLNCEGYAVWNFVDTGGTNRTFGLNNANLITSMNAPTNDDSYGILVGSSDVAFDVAQYNLGSKIPNGYGTGQIGYQGVTIYQDQPNLKTWQRAFVNTSGGDITVREIGFAVKVGYGSPTYPVLLARDVLSTPVTVPNYGTLVVRYTFKINP
jgi:hypothetical protein